MDEDLQPSHGNLRHLKVVYQQVDLGSKLSVWSTTLTFLTVIGLCLADLAIDEIELYDKVPLNMWVLFSLNSVFNDIGMAVAEGLLDLDRRKSARKPPCPADLMAIKDTSEMRLAKASSSKPSEVVATIEPRSGEHVSRAEL
jgi:hypothetical protein